MSNLEDLKRIATLRGYGDIITNPGADYSNDRMKQALADAYLKAQNSAPQPDVAEGLWDKAKKYVSSGFREAIGHEPVNHGFLLAGNQPTSQTSQNAPGGQEVQGRVQIPSPTPLPSSQGEYGGYGGYSDSELSGGSFAPASSSSGDMARNVLMEALNKKPSIEEPWSTSKDVMDKIAGYRPPNVKDIAYQQLLKDAVGLVSGGSWFQSVNDRVVGQNRELHNAKTDSLLAQAGIDDMGERNQIAQDAFSSLRDGTMKNPREYVNLMELLENAGIGKYNSNNVGNMFASPGQEESARQGAAGAIISDENARNSLAQRMQAASSRGYGGGGGGSSGVSDKVGLSLLDTARKASMYGPLLNDPKDREKMSEMLRESYVQALRYSPEAAVAIAQSGIKFHEDIGDERGAKFYQEALSPGSTKKEERKGFWESLFG